MHKAYPYPEIVTGDTWQVNELIPGDIASTDNLNKQMTVPLDQACDKCGLNHSRMVRRHELGHAKWSPKTMGKLMRGTRKEAIEVLEEIRVNYLLYLNGLGINEPSSCIDIIRMQTTRLVYEGSISEIILYGLASNWVTNILDKDHRYYSSDDENREWNRYSYASRLDYFLRSEEHRAFKSIMAEAITNPGISPVRQEELQFALNQIGHFFNRLLTAGNRYGYQDKVTYRKVQKVAEELSLVLDMFMDKPDEVYAHQQPGGADSDGSEDADGEGTEGEAAGGIGPDASNSALEKRMRKELLDRMQNFNRSGGVGYWGEMTVHNPVMTVNLQGRLQNGRQYRPQEYGYNPKYIHRYCVDRRIFKQKQHVLGGTILIDASGSMQFNGSDILEIMQMLPAVTIAMYNGTGNYGDLRVIAKNGMRVDENYLDRHSGRGNIIDGPALQWLASMPERRIWVSDMHVFGGSGNTTGFNLVKDVMQTCTRNKIINLKDIDEVKEHAYKLNVL